MKGYENTQIEGALFGLLTGVVQMGVIHYVIAKISGPLLFGRMWCGWACWTVMVLDLLPFKRPSGRLPRLYGWIRYLHFFLNVSIVLLLFTTMTFTWLYNSTKGSVWIAIVFHAMFNWLSVSEAGGQFVAPLMSVPIVVWAFFIPRRYGMENCAPLQKQTA